jgi:hypothetical protein
LRNVGANEPMSRALAPRGRHRPVLLRPIDEERTLALMAEWAKSARPDFDQASSREWVERMLRHALRTGLVNVIGVIEAAEKRNDPLADQALRRVGRELMARGAANPSEEQILSYLQRVADRDLRGRKQGGTWHNNWRRDFIVCATIEILHRELGLAPTRNRGSRRADSFPSGCSLSAKLWTRLGHPLEEDNIQENIWSGLTGRLTRAAFAQGAGVFLYPNEMGE